MPHLSRLTSLALAIALIGSSALTWAETTPSAAPQAPLPLEDLRTFAEVMDRIKAAYVEPISDKVLLENAIKGMLSNLDPHSAYLEPEDFRDLQESTSGEFGGLGIEVGTEDGFIKVISPIDDTPASAAGIQPGDLIVKIDGQPTKGLSMIEAVDKMRGKAGSKIELSLVREGGKPFDVVLTRAVIKVRSVKSQLLEDNYGYVRVTQFQVNTGEEVGKALNKLRKDNGKKLQGLVLDLRNNPGGVLQAAVEVSDHFLKKGLIVYTEGRIANSELRFSADPADASEEVPLVVLINGGSASASEIVAGALQDHKRGVLMGTDSFGKGSVQTVLPLNNDRALKLTTALYFTPNGRSIQAQGIVPDIEVARAKLTREQDDGTIKEADLLGHLNNGNGGADKPSAGKTARPERPQDDDYQLSQALNLLKGLNVTRGS
ncbi:MAG TPA: S41 family peptidase [Pseudomonas sp.]|jgi:carboxyl-terminal processing protease|uniref:S41 family peptidase n=1 Tax=Pseudomonas sp. TaxID=306 RepID=UPI00261B4DE1|nr:S41 family peptidase [Pseudomonas sp.]HSX87502.1 S41 family peptidase [Pseudomonas sp.]